jgi:hypothetical protein
MLAGEPARRTQRQAETFVPTINAHIAVTLLTLFIGCGCFLRIVAKEKRRREKYLEYRHYLKLKQQEELRMMQQAAEEAGKRAEAKGKKRGWGSTRRKQETEDSDQEEAIEATPV